MNNTLHISKQINYEQINDYLNAIHTNDIDTLSICAKVEVII